MKLKNLKKGGKPEKQTKKEQVKTLVQETSNFNDDDEIRDDTLVDLKEDLKRNQQTKAATKKTHESNKLEETEIDVSKLHIQMKQQEVKPITSWVIGQQQAKRLLQKDFKLQEVAHEFQSLTDTKLNQELKQKKQKLKQERKTQNSMGMKFAPLSLGTNLTDTKNTEKLVFGKNTSNNTSNLGIPISSGPALNFTNSKLNENVQMAPIEKTKEQLRQEQIEKKMQLANEQRAQKAKVSAEINPVQVQKAKGTWFKKDTTEAPKQAPKIQFKQSPWAFTNSNIGDQNEALKFKPLGESKQDVIMKKRQEPELKFVNKKEQQQRRKKRQQEQKQGEKV